MMGHHPSICTPRPAGQHPITTASACSLGTNLKAGVWLKTHTHSPDLNLILLTHPLSAFHLSFFSSQAHGLCQRLSCFKLNLVWPEPAGVNQCKSPDASAIHMGGGFAPVCFLCFLCGELSCLLGDLGVPQGFFGRAN